MPGMPRSAPPKCRGNAQFIDAQAEAQQADAMKQANIEAELALLSEEIDGDFDVALSMIIETGIQGDSEEQITKDITSAFNAVRLARNDKGVHKAEVLRRYRVSLCENL